MKTPSALLAAAISLIAIAMAQTASADLATASLSVIDSGLTPQQQAGLDLGMDKNYAIIALGNGNTPTFSWNSGPVGGNVLTGQGEKAAFSGGNQGGITTPGVLYYDNTVTGTNTFHSLENPPPTSLVTTSLTANAAQIAMNVSNYAAGLTADQIFGDMPGTTTITGNGGLTVVDVTNMHNVKLTLSGTAADYFVFNVSGLLQTNQPMTLLGGIDPTHILFNFTGAGTVAEFQTSGGDRLYGTYLATDGGKFQFSNLNLTGQLINVGGDLAFVSGSQLSIPEPSAAALVLLGLMGSVGTMALRRRRS